MREGFEGDEGEGGRLREVRKLQQKTLKLAEIGL